VLEELHHEKEAGKHFIAAADLRPDDLETQIKAVTWLIALGRTEEGVDRASTLLQHDPNNPRVLILFGNAKAKLTSPTHAIDALDSAWRQGQAGARDHIRPNTLRVDDRVAEDALRKAVSIAPDMIETQTALIGFLWATDRMDEGAARLEKAADSHPELPYLRRALGLFHATAGRDAQAEGHLKKAAAGGDRDSRIALADYYVLRRRTVEAIGLLEPLATAGETNGAAELRLARIYLELGRRDEALTQVECVLEKNPKQAQALLLKSRLMALAGNGPDALKFAGLAIGTGLTSSEAKATLARALVLTGDLEGAFRSYAESWRADASDAALAGEITLLALKLGRDEVALEFARTSVRLDPANQDAALTLAKALVRVRDFAGAEKILAPLMARRGGTVDVLILVGAIQASRGNVDAARSNFLRALDGDRNSVEALTGLVDLEIRNHQEARVRPLVDRALPSHAADPAYLLLAARVAFAQADPARAESLLRTALNANPGHIDAALVMSDVLGRLNRRPDALLVIEQALQKQPESFALSVRQATLLEESGQIDAARARYERLAVDNPQSSIVSVRLAALYANSNGNLDAALRLASGARVRLPNDPMSADTLGWIYVRKGLASRGIPYLLEALQADPSNAAYHYHLGVAHATLGDDSKAATELKRALDLDASFPAAADAKARLTRLSSK
jgi:tetratricopeptide (TPR) repeat protein